ncbi:MAG: RluA family pseudouridine synthase [Deltaproteobacteria bacterium]|nr:RluA family pseudouridine synthase [Deltaproteobacteria bacterium]
MPREIIVPKDEQPKRLDNFLKKRFPIGYVRKLFRKNGVRLNGRRAGPTEMAVPGDRVQLFIAFEEKPETAGEQISPDLKPEIIFEDENLLLLHKPAGIAVHEGKQILRQHSLLGMLETAYRPKGTLPRLVHRLDRDTSGILVVAKNGELAEELLRRFEEGEVEKEYLALVVGQLRPREGKISLALPGREGKPVPALTLYRVEKEFRATSLVRVRTETGRMHQIRLHFAKLGHPVVMDAQHGDFRFNRQFRKAHGLKRQFLHASSVALAYKGKRQKWTAPLPADLQRTLESLEQEVR